MEANERKQNARYIFQNVVNYQAKSAEKNR